MANEDMKATDQLETIAHDCFEILERDGWENQRELLIDKLHKLIKNLSREESDQHDIHGKLADATITLFQAMDYYGFDICIKRIQEKIERQFENIEKTKRLNES